MALPWPLALERYSQAHPQEVLRVQVEGEEGSDVVLIYRGVSSSLMRSTPADVDEAVIPPTARFVSLERLPAPYNPAQPQPLATYGQWSELEAWLKQVGIPVAESH
ncbi:MAG: hypothetical protein Q6K80_03915 [Thermostichus sp. DG_1_6_bins_120]